MRDWPQAEAQAQASIPLAYPSAEGWLVAGWAVLWGALAGGAQLLVPGEAIRWMVALLAGQVLLGTFWATYRAQLAGRSRLEGGWAPLLPYSRPGAAAHRLGLAVGRVLHLGEPGWLGRRGTGLLALVTLAVGYLALGWWLGTVAGWVATAGLAVCLLTGGGGTAAASHGRATALVGSPWLVTFSAFLAPGEPRAVGETAWLAGALAALLATLLYASLESPRAGWGFAWLVVLALPLEQPLASGALASLWLAALVLTRRQTGPGLRRGRLAGLMAALAVLALALARL